VANISRAAGRRFRSGERSFLTSEIGAQVYLGRLDGLMIESKRDQAGVDTGM
jgi:hypothetical protein